MCCFLTSAPQARGYPDIATRRLLNLFSKYAAPAPSLLPVFALVDFDPDGIAIIANYKYGSLNLSHENASLNVSRVELLGLQSNVLLHDNSDNMEQALLRLSSRDRKKAMKMLEKRPFNEHGPEVEWRRELQVMLMLGIKAEIEILAHGIGGVGGWVEDQLHNAIKAKIDPRDSSFATDPSEYRA